MFTRLVCVLRAFYRPQRAVHVRVLKRRLRLALWWYRDAFLSVFGYGLV